MATTLGDPKHTPSTAMGWSCLLELYVENPKSFSRFANKVIGALPVIGLVARITSDEGGVGNDIVDFAEFRRRVGKKCTPFDSRAFYEFQDRRCPNFHWGSFVCSDMLLATSRWLYSSLRRFLEGVARLRISNDIEFEEENFLAMMNESREKQAKLKAAAPTIPMEIRVEKALEAIYVCCFGKDPIEEEVEKLLNVMLSAVFPTVETSEIERIFKDKAEKIAQGGEIRVPEPKALSKEAVELKKKDLQFLKTKKRYLKVKYVLNCSPIQ